MEFLAAVAFGGLFLFVFGLWLGRPAMKPQPCPPRAPIRSTERWRPPGCATCHGHPPAWCAMCLGLAWEREHLAYVSALQADESDTYWDQWHARPEDPAFDEVGLQKEDEKLHVHVNAHQLRVCYRIFPYSTTCGGRRCAMWCWLHLQVMTILIFSIAALHFSWWDVANLLCPGKCTSIAAAGKCQFYLYVMRLFRYGLVFSYQVP